MALEIPDWLARRQGALKRSSSQNAWLVFLDHQPQYALTPVPVKGKFACAIQQTNNGKLLPSSGIFSTPEEALRGGLEDLRKTCGW